LLSDERTITAPVCDSYEHMNLVTGNELLYSRYINSDTLFPFFHMRQCACVSM